MLGEVILPVTLQNVTKFIKFLLVPSARQYFILGMNFGITFGICFDFSRYTWSFAAGNELVSINVIEFPDALPGIMNTREILH